MAGVSAEIEKRLINTIPFITAGQVRSFTHKKQALSEHNGHAYVVIS